MYNQSHNVMLSFLPLVKRIISIKKALTFIRQELDIIELKLFSISPVLFNKKKNFFNHLVLNGRVFYFQTIKLILIQLQLRLRYHTPSGIEQDRLFLE